MSEIVPRPYFETVEIHDRQFQKHSIDHRIYFVPIDEEEDDRLDMQHQMLQHLFNGVLIFPEGLYPMRILDCGYGRGHWAIQVAETYDRSHVTAIDIWPADIVDDQPDNLDCEVWDLNHTLTSSYRLNTYDLINSRFVSPGIKRDRWRTYIRDLVRLLKRGGWVQLAEYHYIIQSDSGRLTDSHALMQWGNGYRHTMERDRNPRVGRHLGEMLRAAGMVDIQERYHQVPIGTWPADEKQRIIGDLNRENVSAMIDSLAIWPFTERMRWTKEQVATLNDRARTEMEDDRLKLYIPLTVVWARKP